MDLCWLLFARLGTDLFAVLHGFYFLLLGSEEEEEVHHLSQPTALQRTKNLLAIFQRHGECSPPREIPNSTFYYLTVLFGPLQYPLAALCLPPPLLAALTLSSEWHSELNHSNCFGFNLFRRMPLRVFIQF